MAYIKGELLNGVRYEFVPDTLNAAEEASGVLQLSPSNEFDDVSVDRVPPFVEILELDQDHGMIDVQLGVYENEPQGDIHLTIDGETASIPMLSAPPLYAVSLACLGTPEEAWQVIDQFYPSWAASKFRKNCRDTLEFEAYVEVMDSLVGLSGTFESIDYRSGLGYFAKRIRESNAAEPGSQSIHSFETLQRRINRWNETEHLHTVELDDVLGEHMGRWLIHSSLSSERQTLEAMGFDAVSYDSNWDTIVPAAWLAHVLLTEDMAAAKTYVNARQEAGNARTRIDMTEFDSETFHYLMSSADDYRGKAKVEPLLYAGALEVGVSLSAEQRQEAAFKKHVTCGHLRRNDHAYEKAIEQFTGAEIIARGQRDDYEYKPEFVATAVRSLAHARASKLGEERQHQDQLRVLSNAIEDLEEIAEHTDWTPGHELTVLRGKKQEALFDSYVTRGGELDEDAEQVASDAIEAAITYYLRADKQKSVNRAQAKKSQL